jgi:hypothetical protein
MNEEDFFATIPGFDDFVEVTSARHYRSAPEGWLVVITDVVGSTKAIEAGRYKDVNSLGVASIVALRNALPQLDLPFVFGGDGATLLVPGTARAEVEATLRGYQELARAAFEMEARAAIVPMREILEAGHEVLVARFLPSPDVHLAMFRGHGLGYAEHRVKDPATAARYEVGSSGPSRASFEGFECRWEPIPSRRGVVASLLIQARAESSESADEVYRGVLQRLQALVEDTGRPVAAETLRLQGLGGNFGAEARIRSGRARGVRHTWRRLKAGLDASVGTILMRRGWRAGGFPGDVYKAQVVANTDFRKFDETLRLVVDVAPATLDALVAELEARREAGEIFFGVHVSKASLMTCAIRAYEGSHVHFVDGADGGYALAAKQLKAQIRSSR